MMRITQQLLSNRVRQNTARVSDRLNRAIVEIQEETSVPAASVDPLKAGRIAAIDERLRNHESLGRSRNTVRSNLTQADTALGQLADTVLSMRDTALAVVGDNVSPENRLTVAASLRRELEAVIALANTQDASGRYLFGGLSDGAQPFAADGTYNGDASNREVEVSPGVRITATVTGGDLFGAGNDTITALSDLVTALETGDVATARNQLTAINTGHSQLLTTRSKVGGRLATLEDLDMLGLDLRTTLESERGNETAVDIGRLSSVIANAQANLQAVIETSKTLMSQSSNSWLS
jgi:flagellin-like hook-associated protein FlgL